MKSELEVGICGECESFQADTQINPNGEGFCLNPDSGVEVTHRRWSPVQALEAAGNQSKAVRIQKGLEPTCFWSKSEAMALLGIIEAIEREGVNNKSL